MAKQPKITGTGVWNHGHAAERLVGTALREHDLPRILGEFFPIIESYLKKLLGYQYICRS
ncbi:MAG TPA: hypothetical protein DDZ56_04790 [Cytophagales bacterium]|nr:hypothetical protein [Cytophagales bacterium]